MKFLEIAAYFFLIGGMILPVIGWPIQLYYWIRCHRKKRCDSRTCRVRRFCSKNSYSRLEILEECQRMLEEREAEARKKKNSG